MGGERPRVGLPDWAEWLARMLEIEHLRKETDPAWWSCVAVTQTSICAELTAEHSAGKGLGSKGVDGPRVGQRLG